MNSFQPVQTSQMPRSEKLKNLIWSFVNKTLFRICPPPILYIQKVSSPDVKGFWSGCVNESKHTSFC